MTDKSEISISGKHIGVGHPPFVTAELSGNHNQSLDRALELVRAAADAGADALKIQTYTADSMTLDVRREGFVIDDPKSLWNGKSLYELYREASTPWEWHQPIFELARKLGMIVFSTPFDGEAVEFLESFDTPCYKIASFEITDLPLIRKTAATGKPLIISTGMAKLDEINDAVQAARETGNNDLILLKCTSSYPANPKAANLRTIPDLRQHFGCEVGLSDHTMGTSVAVASVSMGATFIEKHFTLRRSDGGVDSAFSLEPEELKQLVHDTKMAWQALGTVAYGPADSEKDSLIFRRSLYFVEDIEQGEVITSQNLRAIRPGYGLSPKYYEEILGKKAARFIEKGTPVSRELVD